MSVSQAMQKQSQSPAAMVNQYRDDFAALLPSHINAAQWVRVAQGTIRRNPKLAEAATNSPASLMTALSTAASRGLEPGTEEFYLSPRKNKGQLEVQGITGYQGLIEMIYRAGAAASVVAEVVYTSDGFQFQPGRDERPQHIIDWDAEDRGSLRLVYAYATMKDGATSKVVVLNKADITRTKKSSDGADSQYSPWKNHEAAMWLKTAVRQLAKWVPTSAEYRKEQLRAAQEVASETTITREDPFIQQVPDSEGEHVDTLTGEIVTEESADPEGWETGTQPDSAQGQ